MNYDEVLNHLTQNHIAEEDMNADQEETPIEEASRLLIEEGYENEVDDFDVDEVNCILTQYHYGEIDADFLTVLKKLGYEWLSVGISDRTDPLYELKIEFRYK